MNGPQTRGFVASSHGESGGAPAREARRSGQPSGSAHTGEDAPPGQGRDPAAPNGKPDGETASAVALRETGITARELLAGLQGSDICIFFQDTELVYRWIENPPAGYERGLVGRSDREVEELDGAPRLREIKEEVLRTGEGRHELVEIPLAGRRRTFDMSLQPQRNPDGDVTGILGFAVEVTERIEREARLRVLLREVSHRSRNLLAIVQSIASQTVRTASAPSRFLERFNERLQSLAHTLDLVTVSEWEGATVHQLVSRQAGPFVTDTGVIEISGVDPVLTPNAALHLGLAVQELSSNANNHGIWSRSEGKVSVRTRLEDTSLVFEWSEAGLNEEAPDIPDGSFGARTLTAIVPAAVGGHATVDREGTNFVYRLVVPAGNFDL